MTLRKRGKYFHLEARIGGRRIQRSLHTMDRTVARIKAQDLLNRIDGSYIPPYQLSLEDFKKGYREWASTRKTPETVSQECQRLSRFAAASRVTRIGDVTLKCADDFITKIASETVTDEGGKVSRKISPATVNGYIRSLRAIFSQAKRWGYVAQNPFAGVKKVTEEQTDPRVLTLAELKAILVKLHELRPELVDIVEFYLLTGARRSEAIGLEWSDVDFERETVTFRRTKGREDGKRKNRVIPMSPRVMGILSARRHLAKPFPFLKWFLTHAYKAVAIAAGVPDVTLHDLRRTFGTYLAQLNLHPLGLQQLMGHGDLKVTKEHYIHMQDPALRKKVKELDHMLLGRN